jgi:hypothetical protein
MGSGTGGMDASVFGMPGWSLGRPGDVLRITPSDRAVVLDFERPGAGARDITLVMRTTTRPHTAPLGNSVGE